MNRFAAHGPDRHPTGLFIDVVEDAKRSHAQLPDRRNRLERRGEIPQPLALRGRDVRGMSQVRLDGIQKRAAVIRAECRHVVRHPFRKDDREPHRDA